MERAMTQYEEKLLETDRGQRLVRAILDMHPYQNPIMQKGKQVGHMTKTISEICEDLVGLGLVKATDAIGNDHLRWFVSLVRYNRSAFISLLNKYE